MSLKTLCDFKRGQVIKKSDFSLGNYPVVAGGIVPSFSCDQFNRDYECLTVAGSGIYSGTINYWNTPFFCADAFSIKSKDSNELLIRYLYYFLTMNQNEIYRKQTGGAIPHIYIKDIDSFEILLPPLEVQRKIINFLDILLSYTTDITSGLPAEIQLRQQQLQYYLNRFCCPNYSKQ